MIHYTWKLANLDIIPLKEIDGITYSNIISTVHWRLRGEDQDGYSAEVYGSIKLNTDSINSQSFVRFEDISPQTVVSWVQNIMISQDEIPEEKKEIVASRIEELRNPSEVSKLPLITEIDDDVLRGEADFVFDAYGDAYDDAYGDPYGDPYGDAYGDAYESN